MSEPQFLTMGQAVRRFRGRFSDKTIRRWLERGFVEGACQSGPGGHWSIPADSLDRFADSVVHRRRRRAP